jgi:uncharacterized protein (DUF2267 family)
MATTGLEVFDRTLHTTNLWLDEICTEIGPDKHLAWHVLGAVLRSIRDELLIGQSAHLAAQLPLLVRGAYFDQYRPAAQPVPERSQEDFIARIRDELADSRPVRPDLAATAVMRTLNRHITEGQVKKVRDALPKSVRALWPEPEGPAPYPPPQAGEGRERASATATPGAKDAGPGAPGPSQKGPAERSREAVEDELKRTRAAIGGPSMPHGAPGLIGEPGRPAEVRPATGGGPGEARTAERRRGAKPSSAPRSRS